MKNTPLICFVICAALAGPLQAQEAAKPKALMVTVGVTEPHCDTVDACRAAIAEGKPENREKAIEKLLTFGKHGFAALAELSNSAATDIRNEVTQALTRNRQETAPLLMELFKDPDSRVRENAAGLLGRFWDVVPVASLAEALKDPSSRVRAKAVRTLGNRGSEAKSAVPALIETLKDSDSYVRENAAEALGNIGPAAKDAVPALVSSLADTDKPVREKAAEALGKFGQDAKVAVPALARSLKDPAAGVRQKTAWSLFNLGPTAEEAAAGLAAALGDMDREVRDPAAKALVSIGGAAVQPLMSVLSRDEDGWGVSGAINTLGGIGRPAVPALREALKSGDARLRARAVSTLERIGRPAKDASPVLKALLASADDDARYNILKALWRIEPPPWGVIKEHLNDRDFRVKMIAVSELSRRDLNKKDVIAALINALQDKDIFVSGAAFMPLAGWEEQAKDAVPALIAILQNQESLHRMDAAFTLGRIGPAAKDAVPALKKALEDGDQFLRSRAARALEEINSEEEHRKGFIYGIGR